MSDLQNTKPNNSSPIVSFIITYYQVPVDMLCECIDSILSLSLLVAPAWLIWQPQQIEILQNNKVIATWTTPSTPTDKSTLLRSFVEINISAADKTLPIIIKMEPVTMERATIACDEIIVY